VDAWSGYRYYARHQLSRAALILQLRRAGIALREIGEFLRNPDEARLHAWEQGIDREATDRKCALATARQQLRMLPTVAASPLLREGGITMSTLIAGSACDPGTVRDASQDALLVSSPLFAVADGIGASPAGETASHLALDTLKARFADPLTAAGLAVAARAASQAIFEMAGSDPSLEGMASTLAALVVLGRGDQASLAVASVGDSRAYLLSDGQLHQLTHDHTVVQALMDAGELTPDQARAHPSRSLLTRALGIAPAVDPDIHLPAVRPPARLLLCTDGLTAHAEDSQIADVLASAAEPGQAAMRLVRLANDNGGSDNTTVIVIDISSDQSSP
jgi:serine/threonine protein phosphatase PrpC/DNA-binding transcriptional MerR regulator